MNAARHCRAHSGRTIIERLSTMPTSPVDEQHTSNISYEVLAVIGGTGPQGKGLAYRFAAAGHRVIIGSRSAERAIGTATTIAERIGQSNIVGMTNEQACKEADIVVLAVPFAGHSELVEELAPFLDGKTVVSCVNPLGFDKHGPYGLTVEDGSAAEEAQRLVPGARMVGAFHHLSAVTLWGDSETLEHEDVLICGNDDHAKAAVSRLAQHITGRPGIDAGALRLARQLEPLTSVLISVNKRHKVTAGIRIAGLAHV
ncbi:NADPH-dependent F420 reductase [Rhodococcus sp. NPDC057529]|uniref:NADPH-dependent F420 reductase n=1 Tax=Rhodococcus sp. NPDC057529 TaxID=3346158 RepID=UPI00366F945A